MRIPCNVIIGTPSDPPPIPISTEKNPTKGDKIQHRKPRGICSANRQSDRPKAIYRPITIPKHPKIHCNVTDFNCAANTTLINAPTAMPGAQPRSTCQATPPRFECDVSDRKDVTTIVAKDVAKQICINLSCANPKDAKA